jgi:carboxylesterase type B
MLLPSSHTDSCQQCSLAGLFSRAIAQSGSALNPWAFSTTSVARRRAFRFGEALGCKTNDSEELVKFLSTVPAEQLVEEVPNAMTEEVQEQRKFHLDALNATFHTDTGNSDELV